MDTVDSLWVGMNKTTTIMYDALSPMKDFILQAVVNLLGITIIVFGAVLLVKVALRIFIFVLTNGFPSNSDYMTAQASDFDRDYASWYDRDMDSFYESAPWDLDYREPNGFNGNTYNENDSFAFIDATDYDPQDWKD